MVWYYLFPIVILYIATNWKDSRKAGFLVLAFFLFFSMFRGDEVGVDTMNYMERYWRHAIFTESFSWDTIGHSSEVLYVLLCQVLYYNDLPPRLIIYVFSIITIGGLFFASKRTGLSMAMVGLFYLLTNHYLYSLAAARQLAAVSFCLIASTYLNEEGRKKYLFFLFTLLAATFHVSTLFFIIVYPLKYISVNRKMAAIIVSVFFVVALFLPMDGLLNNIMGGMGDLDYAESYGAGSDYETKGKSLMGLLYNSILFSINILIYMLSRPKQKTNIEDNLFLFSLIITAFFTYSSMVTHRMIFTFSVIQCLYYTRFFTERVNLNTPNIKLIYYAFFVLSYYGIVSWVGALNSPYYMNFSL